MKRILIITIIATVCLIGCYTYLTWGSNGNPRFLHHKYNKVITEPLAKLGFSDAQYKMGLFWLYGSGESEPAQAEIENAVYWWEKASANGNEKATQELAKLNESQQSVESEPTIVYPSKEVEEIDYQLHSLLSDLYENRGDFENSEKVSKAFTERLTSHLKNPLTFENELPRTDSLMNINKTPDQKYKFYSFYDGRSGTTGFFTTYVQYKDGNGNLISKQWDEKADDGKNSTGLLTKIWQFKHNDTDYYVSQKGFQASIERTLSIEIFSISNGKPTYHTKFYPKGVSQQVCYTMNRDHEIDFDFNPATLTVSYVTYENDYQNEGKQIKGIWKLILN